MQPEAHRHKMMPVSVCESVAPRTRGPLPRVCGLVITGVYVLLAWGFVSDVTRLVQAAEPVLYGLCVGVVLHGVCLLAEEATSHFTQRHSNSVISLLKACVCWRAQAAACLLALLCVFRGSALSWEEMGRVLLIAICYVLLKTFDVLAPSEVEISEICESRQMNVAHGLAWSFYQGYLKLVLPLLEAGVEQYNQKRHNLPAEGALTDPWSSRLHILLPLSASVCAHPEDDDPRVSFHDHLPPMEMDRAGVRKRVFKNSVYSIRDAKGQVHYCILEYATPLLTLYQMSQESSVAFGLPERRQQVLLFYRALRNILERSLECRNRCRLILLDDARAGEPHFLSSQILKDLQQQDREEFPMALPPVDTPTPREDKGTTATNGTNGTVAQLHDNKPMSSIELMISDSPHTLRPVPEENSECITE